MKVVIFLLLLVVKKRVCGPEVIKKSSSTTQLSMKISQLINVKMSTVVSILKLMNRKNSILILSKPEKG